MDGWLSIRREVMFGLNTLAGPIAENFSRPSCLKDFIRDMTFTEVFQLLSLRE